MRTGGNDAIGIIEPAAGTRAVVGVDDVNLSTGRVTSMLPGGPSDPCITSLVKTHQIVGHFDEQPVALSLTGRLVVTVVSPSRSDFGLRAVDWCTKEVLWRGSTVPASFPAVSALDEPGGDGLAFTVTTDTPRGTEAADGWLVRPGARAAHLARNVTQGVE